MNKYKRGLTGLAIIGAAACNPASPGQERPAQPITITTPYQTGMDYRAGIGVALGDIDGDGYLDMIVASPSLVSSHINDGTGNYTLKQRITTPHLSGRDIRAGIGVALGDVDGDRDNDLIIASPSRVVIYLNKNGEFTPKSK